MPSLSPPGALALMHSLSTTEPALTVDSDVEDSDDDGDSSSPSSEPLIRTQGIDAPWDWPVFKSLTGVKFSPFKEVPLPGSPFTASEAQNMVSFINAGLSMPEKGHINFFKRAQKDDQGAGRICYLDWCRESWTGWKISAILEDIMLERGMGPYQVMERYQVIKLPDQDQCDLTTCYRAFGEALFGSDGFTADGIGLRAPVRRFLDAICVQIWGKHRKAIKSERLRLPNLKSKAEDSWQALITKCNSGSIPKPSDVEGWLRNVDQLTKIMTRYGDAETIKLLAEQRDLMRGVLDGMGLTIKGKSKTRLPKALQEALELLAQQQDIDLLTHSINTQIKHSVPVGARNMDHSESAPSLDLDRDEFVTVDWEEGVEHLNKLTVERLWSNLGIGRDDHFPFFNQLLDPDANFDHWTKAGVEWFSARGNGQRLLLEPHQIIGLMMMATNAFGNKSTLQMDAVGLGKTIQATALVAYLAFCRSYYDVHKLFPGIFAAQKSWRDGVLNIPKLPILIVTSVGLVPQMVAELRRFLKPGSFDIIPYLGTWKTRPTWWTSCFKRSKLPVERIIIVASSSAIESDYECVLSADKKHPCLRPTQKANFKISGDATVFSRNFTLTIVDEAHRNCNLKKSYYSAFELAELSEVLIAMTATPVQSKAIELCNMGRLMHIEAFGANHDSRFKTMEKQLRRALTKDRQGLRRGDKSQAIVLAATTGDMSLRINSLYHAEMKKWVDIIRNGFAGHVIRRTVWSVDNEGKRISGLEPFLEHYVVINLYPNEMANLDLLSQELSQDGLQKAACFSLGADFYLSLRRATLHPSCNPNHTWKDPKTLLEWEDDPSRKLDILAEILSYHLKEDGRPPLRVVSDRLAAEVDGVCSSTSPILGAQCDKIIVYCAFPSSYVQVMRVLQLHTITALQICGKTSLISRTDILKQFRSSDRNNGSRVLILSNVGHTGLNLPCANLLIIMDVLWSDTMKAQLIGRIWRYPQKKQVHVYNVIAANTQDVFLNNLSFGKAAVMDAFTGTTPGMRSLFEPLQDSAEVEDDEPEAVSASSTPPVIRKQAPKSVRTNPIITAASAPARTQAKKPTKKKAPTPSNVTTTTMPPIHSSQPSSPKAPSKRSRWQIDAVEINANPKRAKVSNSGMDMSQILASGPRPAAAGISLGLDYESD